MIARLIETPDSQSVKIERQDGRVFTVAVTTFSPADQDYVKACRAKSAETTDTAETVVSTDGTLLKKPDPSAWTLLNAGGSQPAAIYNGTQLDQILETINQRVATKAVKTTTGKPLTVRTETYDLATRIKISGDMPRMALATFVQEVARINDLRVKTDPAGMIVLVDKTPADSQAVASFFGVKAKTP